jgi:hypothetical protein
MHFARGLCAAFGLIRMNQRSKDAREVQDAINRILFESWDPIGMNDVLPQDEYENYVGPVYRALSTGANEAKIIAVLMELESQIGCRARWPNKRKAAVQLCALKVMPS